MTRKITPHARGEAQNQVDRLQQDLAAALKERDHYRELFEFAPNGYVVTDLQGVILESNQAVARMLQTSPEALVGQSLESFIDPKDVPDTRKCLQKLSQGFPAREWDASLRYGNARLEAAFDGEPVRDGQGRVVAVRWIIRDITGRKLGELELGQIARNLDLERARLKAVIDNAPESIVVTDEKARILMTNPAAETLYGQPIEYGTDYTSRSWMNVFQADGTPYDRRRMPLVRSALDGEVCRQEALMVVWPDGQKRHLLVNSAPIIDSEGRITGAVALTQDVTERRQAEEAMRESEARYRRLFEKNLAGVYITLIDGTIVDFNDAMMVMLGFDSREEVFQHKSTDFYADPAHRQWLLERLARDGIVTNQESLLVRKDGSTFWATGSGMLVRNSDGKVHIEGVAVDISARMEMEEAVKASLQQRETLLKEVHHRVKNNLQIVSALLGLQARSLQDERSAEVLKEMQDRIKSIALMHEKLYRSESLSNVNMAEYVQVLVMSMERSHGEEMHRVILQVEVPPDLQFDAEMALPCGLILTELVSNAVRHAFPDNREGIVRICLTRRNEECTIKVEDNGVGLPEGFQFPGSAQSMGLQLVRNLSHQLGGKVECTQGPGVSWSVIFPCPKPKE